MLDDGAGQRNLRDLIEVLGRLTPEAVHHVADGFARPAQLGGVEGKEPNPIPVVAGEHHHPGSFHAHLALHGTGHGLEQPVDLEMGVGRLRDFEEEAVRQPALRSDVPGRHVGTPHFPEHPKGGRAQYERGCSLTFEPNSAGYGAEWRTPESTHPNREAAVMTEAEGRGDSKGGSNSGSILPRSGSWQRLRRDPGNRDCAAIPEHPPLHPPAILGFRLQVLPQLRIALLWLGLSGLDV